MTVIPAGRVRHRIELQPAVPRVHAEEFGRRVYFVSEDILGFDLIGGDTITALDVEVTESADVPALSRKLSQVITNDVLAKQPVRQQVVWSRPSATPAVDVFEELVATGAAVEVGEGQVAFADPVLALTDYLDERVRSMVRQEFGATEYRYPTLIATETMRRCGYVSSFPQLMMFVSRLHADVDVYREFIAGLADGGELGPLLHSNSSDVDHCLPPTMCYHTFAQLSDGPLPGGPAVFTSRGKSFRHESRYSRSLERLWDFTIREIVFLGTRDEVLQSRARLMELTYELADELGLTGYCEVANDPFFISEDTPQRLWSQRLLQLKYELRLPLDDQRDVAVCSFNYHEKFFASAFGITSPSTDEVHSACAGFGLERFAYAFLCRHGLDPAGWPDPVRKALGR
jgi:seryl-tRNA synthetase